MDRGSIRQLDRRSFVALGLQGMALAAVPPMLCGGPAFACAGDDAAQEATPGIESVVRPATLFAGIRKPVARRAELEPRIAALEKACAGKIAGPLTLIFRFDTIVEGFDAEIGFPVSEPVNAGEVQTHTLRRMHFFSAVHEGAADTLGQTTGALYQYMRTTGLSPELEMVEVYHKRDTEHPERSRTQVMASYLAWPEVYREQLVRVLGSDTAATVWKGGEAITPHTLVDPRCAWVAASLERLKKVSSLDQQYDILSRVALVRPMEEVMVYKRIYEQSGDINAVIKAREERLSKTATGGFVDPITFDGATLHSSKVPRDRSAYDAAGTPTERRQAYCFCALVREASDPKIDPIFCYRAAGWERQLWEPILGVSLDRCTITHSILKGDAFCAWDYGLAQE